MSDYDIIMEKLENFKKFLNTITPESNKDVLKEYENLDMFRLTLFITLYLLPNKDNIDEMVDKIHEKLDFDKEHMPKVKQYLQLFIDYGERM